MSDPVPPPVGDHRSAKAEAKGAKAHAKAMRPWYKKKRILLPLAILVVIVLVVATSGGSDDDTTTATEAPGADAPAETEPPAADAPAETEPPAEPEETAGQRNAKRSAENYLSFAGFSRDGLIQQLSSDAGDGYSVEDATYAVDALNVDWNEQAYKAAKNYLSISGFSRDGLIEQLSSPAGDKFTVEQATYGADKALAE